MNIIKLLRNYFLLLNSDFFDSKYYLKENADVAKAKANPILHYLKFGWKEGRNPSPLFNTNDYISFRPDILEADICPLVHYELFGKKEFLSFCFDKIKCLERKITELDTKYGNKTHELDTKYGERIDTLHKFKRDILYIYNRGINKEKLSCEIEKFSKIGITDKKREFELIVSLTSYPERIYDIHYCIYSLLKQSLKPNKIILWLAEEQFPNKDKDLSKKLLEFTKYGLIIKYTKDIKQFKKLLPSLKEYQNALIVTADDDIFYPQDWLEKLYNCWKDNRSCIICHRAHKIKIENGHFVSYKKWEHAIISDKPSFYNFFTGAGGILYPPNSLYKDALNPDIFKKLNPKSDDVWFWSMAILNGTKIKIVEEEPFKNLVYVNPIREVGLNNDGALWLLFNKEEKNIQLENMLNYYPQIMEKLLDE